MSSAQAWRVLEDPYPGIVAILTSPRRPHSLVVHALYLPALDDWILTFSSCSAPWCEFLDSRNTGHQAANAPLSLVEVAWRHLPDFGAQLLHCLSANHFPTQRHRSRARHAPPSLTCRTSAAPSLSGPLLAAARTRPGVDVDICLYDVDVHSVLSSTTDRSPEQVLRRTTSARRMH